MNKVRRRLKQIVIIARLTIAYVYVNVFRRSMINGNYWLISEKQSEARDNGYHFFQYLCNQHKEINAVYVITKGSYDYEKVSKLGKVVFYNSFEHLCYYISAIFRICSQVYGVQPFVKEISGAITKIFARKDQKHIFIGHGIKKDNIPFYDYRISGVSIMTCGTKMEYDYYRKLFEYPDNRIALTGLCRFDALHNKHAVEKIILIMPTFRSWLTTSDSRKSYPSESESDKFINSDYYKEYIGLLKNGRLIKTAEDYGYKIIFYLHYTFQPYCCLFEKELKGLPVIIAKRDDYDVQDLLIKSSLLVTDYSSVFFDFAYQRKPVVYFQFDEKEYRHNHYSEGYFSYREHGFGPVVSNNSDVCDFIFQSISNGATLMPKYQERLNNFFIPYDSKNCERLFELLYHT